MLIRSRVFAGCLSSGEWRAFCIWVTAEHLWSNLGQDSPAPSSHAAPDSGADMAPVNLTVYPNIYFNALVPTVPTELSEDRNLQGKTHVLAQGAHLINIYFLKEC